VAHESMLEIVKNSPSVSLKLKKHTSSNKKAVTTRIARVVAFNPTTERMFQFALYSPIRILMASTLCDDRFY